MESKNLKKVDLIFLDTPYSDIVQILQRSIQKTPDDLILEVIDSGLRGRGGAGFPTGLKWRFAKTEDSAVKYVVCNADEGEPGTFKDREILQTVPYKVLTGMAIAGYAIGAQKGYIYLRGEYNFLLPELLKHIQIFNKTLEELGLNFTIGIKSGSGAYICGEETALFESMEGKRGEPRNKPPYPTQWGFEGKPTVINNVETLANIPHQNQNCSFVADTKCIFNGKMTTVVPIYGNGERLGTLIVAKYDAEFDDDDLLLAEYAATVLGVEILHDREAVVSEEIRKKATVQVAFSTLSYSELEAIVNIMGELNGNEGLLVASKIADRVGITRSVIVNALRKFESAGLIETKSLGMKGTYIRVLNPMLFEELKKRS